MGASVMYQKILVPVDGSDHSKRALQESIRMAKMTQGTITLLHVVSKGITQEPCEQAEGILTYAKKIAQAEGVPADSLLLEGKIVEEIVRTAREGNYELIVIGARGLSKFEELVLGSVSKGVTENAPCPVIITK